MTTTRSTVVCGSENDRSALKIKPERFPCFDFTFCVTITNKLETMEWDGEREIDENPT